MRCYGKDGDDHEVRNTMSKVIDADESKSRGNSTAQSSYPRITIAFSPVPVRVFPDLSTWSSPSTSSGANLCS